MGNPRDNTWPVDPINNPREIKGRIFGVTKYDLCVITVDYLYLKSGEMVNLNNIAREGTEIPE